MAEKSEVLVTKEEKIAEAKELFGRGSRNYCMKQYSDAADDLSSCCTIYSELYGPTAAECGEPYLVYAKALIALSKEENNLLVPEEGAEGEDDGADDDEEGGEDEGEDEGEDGNEEEEEEKEKQSEEAGENTEKTSNENKEATKDENPTASSTSVENEPQPGPSTSNGTEQHEETEEGEDEKGGSSLQVAWEILELAVKIFEDQADKSPTNLSECYMELANISFENSNYSLAVNDYKKSLEIYGKIGEPNSRLIAEIDYKVGLCHMMLNEFPESIKFFREACAELSKVIEQEKAKEQTEETRATIKDLEETMQEIIERSREVEETTKTSIEELKRELSKIIVKTGTANGTEVPGELVSSSSSSNGVSSGSKAADKPNDISHLIKRKKPDTTETEVEGSPAKKTAVEAEEVSEGV
ncbi:protein NASP homolog isoform X2 [Malaya genurostris]|nr:protein NASP homolog isoform X2 [Malaya genurostris]XP_058447378.1 protein NASP homolog isoform X2 [Malaya genurostris]XP_058447379.1 protein NASP homolog isoform X2 [Malaya genurostris]XP_058447380.1 protein NASP homolog isoform X2 [Malaya genurostris]XP_058447381.1 protein NASP homolog isoform X2 [Malaya genurostris]